VSIARVALTEGDRADARDALDRAVPRCPRHEVVHDLLRARSVDDGEEALKLAAGAVELAAGQGMLQTVASEGHEVVELVEHVAWSAPAEWLLLGPTPGFTTRGNTPVQAGRSADERELTCCVSSSRLTIRDRRRAVRLGEHLKFHLRMIYRKLGVDRAEAAVRPKPSLRGRCIPLAPQHALALRTRGESKCERRDQQLVDLATGC
jgi:LuxR family maltose regulon positive regulatory protein